MDFRKPYVKKLIYLLLEMIQPLRNTTFSISIKNTFALFQISYYLISCSLFHLKLNTVV